jgi:DNA-directed RNA polymerase specialized sigma24 family protein
VSRDVVALVSADDFVSAVRVYADRVNDLLRRGGVPAVEAIEISETQALALLDAVVNAPETVIDLAGWWFARAIELTTRRDAAAGADPLDDPISVLAGTEGEEQVRAALAALAPSERSAVVLRDGYDLPPQAMGVALRRGTDSAAELTATGRLHLVATYDEHSVPNLSGHSGRTTVDLVTLSRLAEGSLEAPRAASLQRHVANCRACADVLHALEKGRRLVSALPIIAMDDDARQSFINRIAVRAAAVLPSHDYVLRLADEELGEGPMISPIMVIATLVLAGTLGVSVAVLLHSANATSSAPPTIVTSGPAVTPSFAVPETTADSAPNQPQMSISPTSGAPGTDISVTGTGWTPATTVLLVARPGVAATRARVNPSGAFSAVLQAARATPGPTTIRAHDGAKTAVVTFRQTQR